MPGQRNELSYQLNSQLILAIPFLIAALSKPGRLDAHRERDIGHNAY
jgi:hypothetical protein